jgi:hypothetical protein
MMVFARNAVFDQGKERLKGRDRFGGGLGMSRAKAMAAVFGFGHGVL